MGRLDTSHECHVMFERKVLMIGANHLLANTTQLCLALNAQFKYNTLLRRFLIAGGKQRAQLEQGS